jgi:anti-sigma-K factor RskA
MSNANPHITTELISDYAAGRLDAEDAKIVEETIKHDEAIATAVAAAHQVNLRMNAWLATTKLGASRLRL